MSTIVTRALATIPELLARAADRDAQRVWLRTDDGSQTFAGAAGLAGALAHRLRDAGVRHGDLVVVTTRTTDTTMTAPKRALPGARVSTARIPSRYLIR